MGAANSYCATRPFGRPDRPRFQCAQLWGSRSGVARCDDCSSVSSLERCADLLPSFIDELGSLRLVHVASEFPDEIDESVAWPTARFQSCRSDLHPGILSIFVDLKHMRRHTHSRAASAAKRCRGMSTSDCHIDEVTLTQWSMSDDIHPWRHGVLGCFRHQLFDLHIVVLSAFSQNVRKDVPDAIVSVSESLRG